MAGNYYKEPPGGYRGALKDQGTYQSTNDYYHNMPGSSKGRLPQWRDWQGPRVILLGLFILLAINAWFLFPFTQVNHIIVTGNQVLTDQAVQAGTQIQTFNHAKTVLNQPELYLNRLQAYYPIVEDVTILRPSWKTLQIHVEEAPILARRDSSQGIKILAANGVVLTELPGHVDLLDLPLIYDFDQPGRLKLALETLTQVKPEVRREIAQIYLSQAADQPEGIELLMKDGNIVLGLTSTLAEKLNYYPQIQAELEGRVGLVNLEVGAYFTPDTSQARLVQTPSDQ